MSRNVTKKKKKEMSLWAADEDKRAQKELEWLQNSYTIRNTFKTIFIEDCRIKK